MKSAPLLLFFLLISACSFGPSNLQSKHSSDLEARNIKRIAVLSPAAMVKSQTKIPFTTASAADARAAERDPAGLLSKLAYSAMAPFSTWRSVSERLTHRE